MATQEKLEYLQEIHVALAARTPEALTENLWIYVYKGAEKYDREAGIIE